MRKKRGGLFSTSRGRGREGVDAERMLREEKKETSAEKNVNQNRST